jgi:hypothetical protein
MSLHNPTVQASIELNEKPPGAEVSEETPEQRQKRDRELGLALFGQSHQALHIPEQKVLASSPMIHAKPDHHVIGAKVNLSLDLDDIEMGVASWSMMSPEQIDVEDLDEMFMGF